MDIKRCKEAFKRDTKKVVEWVPLNDMTDAEKERKPSCGMIGGYLKVLDEPECGQIWWDGLTDEEKGIIKDIPNFDKEIFKEITGIKTE